MYSTKFNLQIVVNFKVDSGNWRLKAVYSNAFLTLGSDGRHTLDGSCHFGLMHFLESNETVTFEQLRKLICDSYVMGRLEIDGDFERSEVELIARICLRANADVKYLILYCKVFDESMQYLAKNIEAQEDNVSNLTSLAGLSIPPVPQFSALRHKMPTRSSTSSSRICRRNSSTTITRTPFL